jgi:hypothetical protein
MGEWVFSKATGEGINTDRIYQKPSKKHGIKYVFSSKNDGIGEIRRRVLAWTFQTRNSFENIKILKTPVWILRSSSPAIGVCFRALKGI